MIGSQELTELARELSLPVVEKDYVLGWLLAGINLKRVVCTPSEDSAFG